jgi:hypothetical protein
MESLMWLCIAGTQFLDFFKLQQALEGLETISDKRQKMEKWG